MPKQKCEKQKYPNQNMWERSESSKKRASPSEHLNPNVADIWIIAKAIENKTNKKVFSVWKSKKSKED